jgi:predicted MFS family arabinose efflux permease
MGLRRTFLLSNAIMMAGALLMALAPNVAALLMGRLIIGVAGGLTTVLTPMYLASIAPYGTQLSYCASAGILRKR